MPVSRQAAQLTATTCFQAGGRVALSIKLSNAALAAA